MHCGAGTVTDAVARDGPGSAEQRFKLHRVRDKITERLYSRRIELYRTPMSKEYATPRP